MGSDLQYSQIAFLAVVNVFDVIIFSGALFHTLAASHVKLFFAFVDLPTSVRSPRVRLLFLLWVIGSFPHFCQFDLRCNLIN